jgi:glutathione S-transferase
LEFVEKNLLNGKSFVVGNSVTIADFYLRIVLSWTAYVGIDLSPYPNVTAYCNAFDALPVVQDAKARIATNPTTTF